MLDKVFEKVENKEVINFIPLRFNDYCRGCGQKMAAGTPAAWFGKKGGVKHINCYLTNKSILEASLEW